MLVMTRKISETIKIGEAVVQILDVQGNRVRLGITAPQDVVVTRGENLKEETDADRPAPKKSAAG